MVADMVADMMADMAFNMEVYKVVDNEANIVVNMVEILVDMVTGKVADMVADMVDKVASMVFLSIALETLGGMHQVAVVCDDNVLFGGCWCVGNQLFTGQVNFLADRVNFLAN